MKKVSNMKELEKAIMPDLIKMVDTMAERVYETLNYFLQEYYNSYNPISYQRQYDFLHSAVKVKPKVVSGQDLILKWICRNTLQS